MIFLQAAVAGGVGAREGGGDDDGGEPACITEIGSGAGRSNGSHAAI